MPARKSRRRSPNGRSTFINEGNGRWRALVSMGKDPVTGSYIRKTVRGTRQEVNDKVAALEAQRAKAGRAGTSDMLLGEYLELWLAHRRRLEGKESTLSNYESHCRVHLVPLLGDVPLSELTFKRIEQCLARMTRSRPVAHSTTPPHLLPASAHMKAAA